MLAGFPCPQRQALEQASMKDAPNVTFRLMSPYPELKRLDQKVSLESYRGKPTVVHFYTG